MSRLEIGSHIDGKYEVLSRLKEGGMGEVYRVRHLHLQEVRVIKVLKADLMSRPDAAERFHREARLATQVKHPRVATLHDYSRLPDGSFYMVWEFIDGQDVESWLREKGVFPVPIALELAIQALSGLEAIHRAGIVHRDLSPDNLMITSDRRGRLGIKIIDLGLAKGVEDHGRKDSSETGFGGKLNYCSPEHVGLIEGVRPDQLSDVFSAAIIFYKMVCGQLPFDPIGPGRSLEQRFRNGPLPLSDRNPEVSVPEMLDAVLRRALAFDRAERYPAASSLREALQEMHQPERGPRRLIAEVRPEEPPGEGEPEATAVIQELRRRVELAETQRRHFQVMQARELVEQYVAARHEPLARLSLETLLELDPDHPEQDELRARIDELATARQRRSSSASLIRELEEAVETGDFETARERLGQLQPQDRGAAERLRRRIDFAEQQRQLDDQVSFHRGRLEQFLGHERIEEAALELDLLEGLELPRLVVDLYRRRIEELRRRHSLAERCNELERLAHAQIQEGRFREARDTAMELGRIDGEHPAVSGLLAEIDSRQSDARKRLGIAEGVQTVRSLLASRQLDQARLALTVLRRMAPDEPVCEELERDLRILSTDDSKAS